jgi:hypothetical protein
MEEELFEEALKYTCERTDCSEDIEKLKMLKNSRLVYDKYLYVQPPIPGETLDKYDYAKNILSMKYNLLYNSKYNINPYDSRSFSEDDDPDASKSLSEDDDPDASKSLSEDDDPDASKSLSEYNWCAEMLKNNIMI